MTGARIIGVAGYQPRRAVDNDELATRLDTSDDWIRRRTGIRARGVAAPDESIVDMGVRASADALRAADVEPRDVDCVIVATMSNTTPYPSAAALVADALGLSRPAAFDISAACAGFSYALELARGLITAGTAGHVLVIGAERMTDVVDPNDRSTVAIFGDGAGAVVVGQASEPGVWPAVWGSDGSQADLLCQQGSWADYRDVPGTAAPYLRMRGRELFRWVVNELPEVMRQALARADVDVKELRALIPHQANDRITSQLVEAIDLPPDVPVARDIAWRGNTSAASIPLAMAEVLRTNPEVRGGLALLAGFGAGLTYSAQTVRLP